MAEPQDDRLRVRQLIAAAAGALESSEVRSQLDHGVSAGLSLEQMATKFGSCWAEALRQLGE